MKDVRSEAAELGFKAHARRVHLGIRRPHNWLQLIRYCMVGASGYVINLGTFSLLYRQLPYLLAFTVAFACLRARATSSATIGPVRRSFATAIGAEPTRATLPASSR